MDVHKIIPQWVEDHGGEVVEVDETLTLCIPFGAMSEFTLYLRDSFAVEEVGSIACEFTDSRILVDFNDLRELFSYPE